MSTNATVSCSTVTGDGAPWLSAVDVYVDGQLHTHTSHTATDDGPRWTFDVALNLEGDHTVQVFDTNAEGVQSPVSEQQVSCPTTTTTITQWEPCFDDGSCLPGYEPVVGYEPLLPDGVVVEDTSTSSVPATTLPAPGRAWSVTTTCDSVSVAAYSAVDVRVGIGSHPPYAVPVDDQYHTYTVAAGEDVTIHVLGADGTELGFDRFSLDTCPTTTASAAHATAYTLPVTGFPAKTAGGLALLCVLAGAALYRLCRYPKANPRRMEFSPKEGRR